MTSPSDPDCLIVGAGLAGLSCAVRLHEAGKSVLVLEASDGFGGRVRTDEEDGFLLDRGFQVYLDAYPEAGEFLDLEALDLRPFRPGALVWKEGKLRPVMDVFRRPSALFSSALQPIGTLRDKLLVAKLRFTLLRKSVDEIWAAPETTTLEYLREFGFSDRMIDDFFRSFYGGIFLENELTTSSRIFEFTFKMFSKGSATLPAKGMQQIPEQLTGRLPDDSIQLKTPVVSISEGKVKTEEEDYPAKHVVIATDGSTAANWFPDLSAPQWNSTSCLYFSADKVPWSEPVIALQGDRTGLVNNACVVSNISSRYAPEDHALISVSVLGDHADQEALTQQVQDELVAWFGEEVKAWTPIRTEHIRKALPISPRGHLAVLPSEGNVYLCGDLTTSGSIEGAILSGLRTAEKILEADE
ncbi:MAG: NAD(P)/FAD-dependent oxidoreductase [Verrucomicrobiota bacterium]